MGRRLTIGLAVSGSLVGAALAQDSSTPSEPMPDMPAPAPSDPLTTMVGVWEFSNADHDKICRFTFRADQAAGGYKVDIDRNCAGIFPSTKDITGWSLDTFGTLHLLDPRGNPVIELSEAEAGIFDGFQPGEGRYVLQSATAPPVRSAEDMFGDWAIARVTGKTICQLTLANNPAGANNLTLKLKPGCDPLVLRFAPTAWRVDRGELLLLSARGQAWRFAEDDVNTWSRVPQGPDPFILVRQ